MTARANQLKNSIRGEKKPKGKKEGKKLHMRLPEGERFARIIGVFFIAFSFFLLLAFTGFLFSWSADHSVVHNFGWKTFQNANPGSVENIMGVVGALMGHLFIYKWFGIASYLFIYLFFLMGFRLIFGYHLMPFLNTLSGTLFMIIWLSIAIALVFYNTFDILGGAFGYFAQLWLRGVLGTTGTVILLVLSLLAFLILAFNFTIPDIKEWWPKRSEKSLQNMDGSEVVMAGAETVLVHDENAEKSTHQIDEEDVEVEHEEGDADDDFVVVYKEEEEDDKTPDSGESLALEIETAQPEEEESTEVTPDNDYDPKLDLSNYKYPTLELLREYDNEAKQVSTEELEERKNLIVDTLKHYNIEIDKIKATIGPTVTLYEIIPAPGIRISKIKSLEDDIALSLAALGIRIIAPIPGKGTIGIEVPNQNPEMVSMRSILASAKFQKSDHDLPIALGKTISNEVFIADLAKMPHLLMAGATGQGKSVGLNAIITSLLYKKHPSQIKFVMVDPKKVELSLFRKIERHFLAKLPNNEEAIITDTKQVVTTLNSLCAEMDSRYDLLKDAHVRNIKEYNRKFISRKLNPNEGHRYLPYIVLIIDELADLMMTAGKEVETPIARLAQLARAIGIHLILATQRPSVNIITGVIKANFPARLAFRVTSKIDSRTILDSGGADQLIGRGDMLLSTGGELTRMQCAFVDTDEVEEITDYIGNQQGYPAAYQLPEVSEDGEAAGGDDMSYDDYDELFDEAARVIVQNQQGSTSLIQRRLKLGYNRAGRLIDQLESAGIVGPFEGSKARQVLISDEYALEQYLTDLKQQNK